MATGVKRDGKWKTHWFIALALSVLLAFSFLTGQVFGSAQAESASLVMEKKLSGMGARVLRDPSPGKGNWDRVYFGSRGEPLCFHVLASRTTDFGDAAGPAVFLDCADLVQAMYFDDEYPFEKDWASSTIRAWLNGDFLDDRFTAAERSALLPAYKEQRNQKDGVGWEDLDFVPLGGEKAFLLDAAEVTCPAYGFENQREPSETRRKSGLWWLRSTYNRYSPRVGRVDSNGRVSSCYVRRPYMAVSPAVLLNRASVLYTSRTEEGGYKLTVLDPLICMNAPTVERRDRTVQVSAVAKGLHAFRVNRYSVLMTNGQWTEEAGWGSDAALKYYGKLDETASFQLPENYNPQWHTYLIAEIENEGTRMDYASAPVLLSLLPPPVL